MLKNNDQVRPACVIILAVCFVFATSQVCVAQVDWSRAKKNEIFGTVQTWGSDTVSGSSGGIDAKLEFDSTTLFGLGLGTNITDHWNINTDFLFGSTDLTATVLGMTIPGDVDMFLWDVNVDYNILKDRLTPLVTGGLGFARLSGEYTGGVDFSETDFTYNVGVGGRWDISDNFMVKVLYRLTWVELEDADAGQFDGVTLSVAYMFE